MIKKNIIFFGIPFVLFCDENCNKAWGINSRPENQLSEDDDDYEYLADGELGEAPDDPGTSEGFQSKPCEDEDKLNKWCCRECERSEIIEISKINEDTDLESLLSDFSKRLSNIPKEKVNE